MSRRSLLRTGIVAALGAGCAGSQSPAPARANHASQLHVSLREKFHGCIAGDYVGSSMGAAVEGWDWQRIEKEHGTLEKLLPYHQYRGTTDWVREPGTTEDGVERQKLMIKAILDKKDRVNAEDVRQAWVKYMNPNAPGIISEPFEGTLLAIARTPIPAADIGKYCDYSGLISAGRPSRARASTGTARRGQRCRRTSAATSAIPLRVAAASPGWTCARRTTRSTGRTQSGRRCRTPSRARRRPGSPTPCSSGRRPATRSAATSSWRASTCTGTGTVT